MQSLSCPFLLTMILLAGPPSDRTPHNQDAPPGPSISPAEAAGKMTLAEGLTVEVFAAEPDLINPTAMLFDDRGRVWVSESLEYPRLSPGPGRDCIKVLEDADGDGRADTITVFADDLNIPSGLLLGYGGLFVANAPDLLFLKDTDGDGRADIREVLLTGFGRYDVHELPCCLTWGPDGWLYGLNGVFNRSKITHQGKTHTFTCALWRYHPRTRKFEVFCEGTSNPWGLDYDGEGSFFVSACVIDHLWHLTETGYYHRQAGAYPPHTWKIQSIVSHHHQKAAYCGLCWFDSPVLGDKFRGLLLMGNIHGSAINVDRIQRKGSTYAATPEPDLLQAHDAWFMPVAQKVGPDGALWILDWYDRYHCYQDARRDPEGIDRGLGRLYRIAPPSTPRYAGDINKLSDQELLHLLADENVWKRRQARQKLIERGTQSRELEAVALDRQQSAKARLEALWTRAGQLSIPGSLLSELRDDADPVLRAWSVRLAGDFDPTVGMAVGIIGRALNEADPRVTLETVIAAGKRFPSQEAASRIMESASRHPEDTHLQQIAWKNLNAHLPASTGTLAQIFESHSGRIVTLPDGTLVRRRDLSIFFSPENLAKSEFLARLISRLFTLPDSEETHVTSIMKSLLASTSPQVFRLALRGLFDASREKGTSAALAKRIAQSAVALPHLHADDEVARLGLQLLTGAADARSAVLSHLQEGHLLDDERLSLLEALCLADETPTQEIVALLPLLVNQLKEGSLPELWRILARRDGDEIGHALLKTVSTLAPQSRPQVVDVLISRPKWADLLLTAVEQNAFDKGEVGIQHIRSLAASRQSALRDRAAKIWGQVRPHDAAERTAVVQRMRAHLNEGKSNPYAGKAVFERVCAQCHKLRGQGHDLGPELTRNGTDSLDNLLTSIFDPNLLIGDDYEAKLIITVDGRSLQGLVVESTDERIVLKVPGGQLVNILRAEIDELTDSKQSLMPEGLEQQLSPKDLRDLIAYIRQSSTTK